MRGYCTACGTRVSYYAEQCRICRQRESNNWREREKVHLAKQQARLAALPRAIPNISVPREIVIGNCAYTVVWDGRGPLPSPAGNDTPKNLGSSLLDSSPLRQW